MCIWFVFIIAILFIAAPVMINIPNEGQKVSVHVLSTKNSAYLDTSSMYALDFEGNTIKVDASKNTFSHCLCANSTEFVIAKSVPDKFGNYAETTFQVNIIGKCDRSTILSILLKRFDIRKIIIF